LKSAINGLIVAILMAVTSIITNMIDRDDMEKQHLSCSEIIQLVVNNKGE